MTDEDPEPTGFLAALRERTGVLIGIVGLIAWFALVWLMFGDVL